MTAATPTAPMAPAGRARLSRGAEMLALWRRLTWVTWRQHRTSLTVVLALFALPAVVMAVTGLNRDWHARVIEAYLGGPHPLPLVLPLTILYVGLLPCIVGLLLGAPLLASEAESGLLRFTWTQGVGKSTLLITKVLTITAGLLIAAFGLSAEVGWWTSPALRHLSNLNPRWIGPVFSLRLLPYAGWTVFAFCAGVALGVLTRRTVPALVGTVVGYAAVFYLDNWHLRPFYLPPLRSAVPFRMYGPAALHHEIGRTANFVIFERRQIGRFIISSGFLRRNGQPLVDGDLTKSQSWIAHHIVYWTSYQHGSRFVLFQSLELGYLLLLSGLLVLAAMTSIRRRSV
jgi:hypothetical protein